MSVQERTGGNRLPTTIFFDFARRLAERLGALRRRARRQLGSEDLARLDGRLLRDIGLTRFEARAIADGLLALREPPAGPARAANVVRLAPRGTTLRTKEANAAPPLKHAAGE